jgi:hypothetical protein
MIAVTLNPGTYSPSFSAGPRLVFLPLAVVAALACLRGVFLLAASVGIAVLLLGGSLLWMMYDGLAREGMNAWARPGWGFYTLLAAAAALASLPFWARPTEGDSSGRPPNEVLQQTGELL